MTAAPAKPSGFDAGRLAGLLLPYMALVLLHLLSGLEMRQPLILADELGYLGNARYLAGEGHLPDMRGSQFYHFGYSLFLLPAFWLFSEPTAIYRAVVVINSLLAAALYFPLFWILSSFAGLGARAARWIAFVCCLYPALLLYSNIAWSESAFVPFFALSVALLGRYLTSRSWRDLLLLTLLAGFLFTIHPRALPVLAVTVVYLLLLAILRVVPARQLIVGVGAMAAVLLSTRAVNEHLKQLAWAGGGEISAARLASRLLPGADFPALVERALGQMLYLALASHGLFPLGLMAMIWPVYRGLKNGSLRRVLAEPGTGVPLFVLATGAGIFAGACTLKLYSLHGPRAVRGADFIHGRYNEALAVLAIAFALAWLGEKGLGNRLLFRRLAVAVLVMLGLALTVTAEVDDALERQVAGRSGSVAREAVLPTDVDAVAVPGVYPLVGMVGALDPLRIAALAVAGLLLIALATRLSRAAGLATLAVLFCLFSFYNHRHYVLRRVEATAPRLAFAEEVRRLGPFATISHDLAFRETGFVAALQFLVPESVFERFDSEAGDEPVSEAVIGTTVWPQADRLGARFVTSAGRGSAFWLLPGEAQSRLPAVDYLDQTLGVESRPGLRETGFYRTESFNGVPGRWTNGAATLIVPVDPRRPPRALEIRAMAPGRESTRLEITVNGVRWRQTITPEPWSRRLGLRRLPASERLLIELRSDTFIPAARDPSSRDRRRLGIVLQEIRLLGPQRPSRPKR